MIASGFNMMEEIPAQHEQAFSEAFKKILIRFRQAASTDESDTYLLWILALPQKQDPSDAKNLQ